MFTFLSSFLDGKAWVFTSLIPKAQMLATNFLGQGWDYKDCNAAYNGTTNLIGPAELCSHLGDTSAVSQKWGAMTTNFGKHPANY